MSQKSQPLVIHGAHSNLLHVSRKRAQNHSYLFSLELVTHLLHVGVSETMDRATMDVVSIVTVTQDKYTDLETQERICVTHHNNKQYALTFSIFMLGMWDYV